MEIKRNSKLKTAIFEAGLTQREFSRIVGVPETYLSQAVNGRYNLNEEQRKKISEFLRIDSKTLFNSALGA